MPVLGARAHGISKKKETSQIAVGMNFLRYMNIAPNSPEPEVPVIHITRYKSSFSFLSDGKAKNASREATTIFTLV